jgi:cell division protein FtsQ
MIIPRAFYANPYPAPSRLRPVWKGVLRRKRCGATSRARRPPGQGRRLWQPCLRWLGVVIALLAGGYGLYLAGQKLFDPARFPLRHVYLQGELRNLSPGDLQELVQRYLGQNFFVLNIAAVQAAVAANPWIEQASVSRQWPDTVKVRFQERTPFGHWGQDEMVDLKGERFRPTMTGQPGPWPQLAGPEGHEMTLIRAYREASAILDKVGLRPTRLVQDERRAWWLTTDNGLEISLGREQFLKRLQRFADIYPQVLAGQSAKIAAVDLRYTHGFTVRWTRPSPTPGTPMANTAPAAGSRPAVTHPKTARAG